MASLLATVPDTGRLGISNEDAVAAAAVSSPSFQLTKSALIKLASDEVDSAFSPLSSSTITIASLGSSLGYGGNSSSRAPLPATDAMLASDSDSDSSSSSSRVEQHRTTTTQLGLRGISAATTAAAAPTAATVAADESLVTSSANLSTAVSSSAASAHSNSSSSLSLSSVSMPRVNMRSVSVDYARAYGLNIRRTMASATTDAMDDARTPTVAATEAAPAPAVHVPPTDSSSPAAHPHKSGTASSSAALAVLHQNLVKRIWRQMGTRKVSEGNNTAANSTLGLQPGAVAGVADEDVPLSDSETRIVGSQSQLHLDSKGRGSQDTCSDNDCVIVERNSAVAAAAVVSSNNGLQDEPRADVRLDPSPATAAASVAVVSSSSATATATAVVDPLPSDEAPHQPRKYRFSRAMPSKSLDAAREPVSVAGPLAKGPLNRRVLQRNKREDAIYGVGVSSETASASALGPERFQALSRSFASRLGFASTLAARRRPEDLRYVIAPHPQLPEVVEVYDCDERAPVYRKISRSGRSWHETFHEVNAEEELAELEAARQHVYWRQQLLHRQGRKYGASSGAGEGASALAMSDYEMASALGLPYPGIVGALGGRPKTLVATAAAASCVTFLSSASSSGGDHRRTLHDATAAEYYEPRHVLANGGLSNQSTASFLFQPGTVRMARASTSVGGRGLLHLSSGEGASSSSGGSFDRGLLWEALTPYPNQFPLHVKDARTIIDTVSLASMVLDRHHFCYRFQLGANRMRWTAKRARKNQLALVCLVRNTVVAEIFVDYEKGYSPYDLAPAAAATPGSHGAGFTNSNSSSGVSTPRGQLNSHGMANQAIDVELPEDGSFPLVTILSAAFEQLADFDTDVVESFIIFTGLQTLECLHI